MSSIKTNVLSSDNNMAQTLANYYALVWRFVLMGPNHVLKQDFSFSSSTDFLPQVLPMHAGYSSLDTKKIRSPIPKGAFDLNRLKKSCTRNGFERESLKVRLVVVYPGSEVVCGTFYLDPLQTPHIEKGYEIEMDTLDATLNNLFLKECESASLKSPILKPFFQQQLPETTVSVKEGILEKCSVSAKLKPKISNEVNQQLPCETKEFEEEDILEKCSVSAKLKPKISNEVNQQLSSQTEEFEKEDLLKECSVSSDIKPISNQFQQQLPSETKEFVKNSEDSTEKPVLATVSNNKVESQTSDHVPDCTSKKSVQTCDECRETIKVKKFFDERRFGILEKCMCVICYGCIRKTKETSNVVVKGPVRCPRCFVKSDKVASSATWIEGKEKVEFFKEYRKNLEYTNIKLRLGWTCFPTRKNDEWARRPYMLPVN